MRVVLTVGDERKELLPLVRLGYSLPQFKIAAIFFAIFLDFRFKIAANFFATENGCQNGHQNGSQIFCTAAITMRDKYKNGRLDRDKLVVALQDVARQVCAIL
jgi:hypothetical protein